MRFFRNTIYKLASKFLDGGTIPYCEKEYQISAKHFFLTTAEKNAEKFFIILKANTHFISVLIEYKSFIASSFMKRSSEANYRNSRNAAIGFYLGSIFSVDINCTCIIRDFIIGLSDDTEIFLRLDVEIMSERLGGIIYVVKGRGTGRAEGFAISINFLCYYRRRRVQREFLGQYRRFYTRR